MKLSKLCLAMAGVLGTGMTAEALALDLYVDTKTQQIYAEPGKGRVLLGEFQKVSDAAAPKTESADLKAEIQQIKEDLALKTNELRALDEHIKDPNEGKLHINEKGIKFESKDGNFEMAINGRMQVDSQMNVSGGEDVKDATGTSTPNQLSDGTNIRRARLGVEGSFYKDYEYKFEYDFSRGNGTVAAGITDAYINWKAYDPFGVKVGSFKEPFSLEEATSNRWITFIERNMAVNAFSDNPNAYKTGLGLTYAQPRWQAAGAIMTEPVGGGWSYDSSVNGGNGTNITNAQSNNNGNNNRANGSGDSGWELTGRVTALPWFEDKNKFLHVGVSGSERYVNNNFKADKTFASGGMNFNAAINSNVDRTSILNTGNLTSAKGEVVAETITRFGGESALVYGPFSAQAEYIQTDISGKGYNDESLNGYYGYASYFLTGESRAYKAKTGAWDRLKPKRNFDGHGGLGAWEVAMGYDYLDLTDGIINGGRAATAKFGINWYPNSHVKLMANVIHALEIETGNVASVTGAANARSRAFDSSNLDMVEFRGQVDF